MTKSVFRALIGLTLWVLAGGHAFAAPIAYVHELTGDLQAQYGSKKAQSLKAGGTIESGAVLTTSTGSNAVVKFEDGQVVALQPDTKFAVREYKFVASNVAKSNSAMELLTGALRFVTGVIGATNKNAFKLTAGTATIGIRGTDGSASFNPATGEVHAATNQGALVLTTPLGTSPIPLGNFVTAPRNAPPAPPAPIAQAPAPVAQVINQTRTVSLPNTTPVAVPASARAAAAEAQVRTAQRAVQAATTDQARQAAERTAQQARAAAATAEQAAERASQQATQRAVQGGAVLAAPPAPPAPAPAPAPAAPTTTTPRPGATAPTPTTTPAATAPASTDTTVPSTTSTATPASTDTATTPSTTPSTTTPAPTTSTTAGTIEALPAPAAGPATTSLTPTTTPLPSSAPAAIPSTATTVAPATTPTGGGGTVNPTNCTAGASVC